MLAQLALQLRLTAIDRNDDRGRGKSLAKSGVELFIEETEDHHA